MFGIFVHYSIRPIYDVSVNLFCWPPSVVIFNILPDVLSQPLLKKDKINMVSLYTLRDCLGLSFQGMYIYLVIIIIIIIIIKWSTVQRSFYEYWIKIFLLLLLLSLLFFIQFSLLNRSWNPEESGLDNCPCIDTIYFTENALKNIKFHRKRGGRGALSANSQIRPCLGCSELSESQLFLHTKVLLTIVCEKKYLNKNLQIPLLQVWSSL